LILPHNVIDPRREPDRLPGETDERGALCRTIQLKISWIERVLGVSLGGTTQAAGAFVSLQTARLEWGVARAQARAEVKKLESEILKRVKGKPFEGEVVQSTFHLYTMFDTLDDRLIDALDAALSAKDASARAAHHKDAANITDEYIKFVGSDPLLQAIDHNPFLPISVHKTFSAALSGLRRNLG
jgi:hypothetical protein